MIKALIIVFVRDDTEDSFQGAQVVKDKDQRVVD